ncbi:MAG: BrnT family toxin [Pseudobutyrivibrio sp.]|nr:BrnT family toxin [Pseudobutyrivibrio sp.]
MCMNGIKLEWDEEKEKINIKKHGISFSTAAFVFNDPNRLEYYDEEHSISEDRYATIGLVGNVLTVIYTIRGETHRIISARIATKAERSAYYGN